mgnify:FL=1
MQLNRIVDPEVKAFILLCLQPAATRPSARQLLNHPFLLEKSDEKSNQPVELLERTAVTEPASTEGRASVEHGYFVLGLDEENPGEVMLLDTLEMGQNVLQLKLKLNLKHGTRTHKCTYAHVCARARTKARASAPPSSTLVDDDQLSRDYQPTR